MPLSRPNALISDQPFKGYVKAGTAFLSAIPWAGNAILGTPLLKLIPTDFTPSPIGHGREGDWSLLVNFLWQHTTFLSLRAVRCLRLG